MSDVTRLFAAIGADASKARRASRLLIYWQMQGFATQRARLLSCALGHQAALLDWIAVRAGARVPMRDSVCHLALQRDLALVVFYSSLASDRRSGHQETTQ